MTLNKGIYNSLQACLNESDNEEDRLLNFFCKCKAIKFVTVCLYLQSKFNFAYAKTMTRPNAVKEKYPNMKKLITGGNEPNKDLGK